jgi:hypothetical protein
MNPIFSPIRPPTYHAAIAPSAYQASIAPPPYESLVYSVAPATRDGNGSQELPPSYVESAINVDRRLRPGRATNLDRVTVLKETFRELFEGTIAGFSTFDRVAAEHFMDRPADARRLMSAIERFDVSIADLFEKIPALAKCVKRGKVKHPVVGNMLEALASVDRELGFWATSPNGSPPFYLDPDSFAVDARVVQDLRSDLRALSIALRHFHRHGTLSDEIELPGSRGRSGCTVL